MGKKGFKIKRSKIIAGLDGYAATVEWPKYSSTFQRYRHEFLEVVRENFGYTDSKELKYDNESQKFYVGGRGEVGRRGLLLQGYPDQLRSRDQSARSLRGGLRGAREGCWQGCVQHARRTFTTPDP